jgi:cyclohexadieny/prephenate dehydrogenase
MTHANAETLPFQTIGIVGCGMIGCSLAAALKSRKFRGQIVGCGRPGANLETALARGLVDRVESEAAKTAAACDFLVVCTPVDRIADDVRALAKAARPGTLITDAGSVKQPICRSLEDLPAGVAFIGSHPIAGSEKQGCAHADAQLFVDRVCVVTPLPSASRAQVARVGEFWQALGMSVVEMSPEAHDRALAQTSHVPHAVAAALAASLDVENRGLTAGGFQDTTRIAAGDPELWSAILLANAGEVAAGLRTVSAQLAELLAALETHDKTRLQALLRTAKQNRDGLSSARANGVRESSGGPGDKSNGGNPKGTH